MNTIEAKTVSTSNLLQIIPLNNAKPGTTVLFQHINDGGCSEVKNPMIDLITLSLSLSEIKMDHLLILGLFVVALILDSVTLPKEEKEDFFSLDKTRRATGDKVR